jgi:hypothetical protein
MNCPVCGRLEYDCECEPSEPIPEIGGEDDTEDALREHQEEARKEYNSDKAKLWSDIAKLEERQKKDAGLERLLCAVLFEEGEPN